MKPQDFSFPCEKSFAYRKAPYNSSSYWHCRLEDLITSTRISRCHGHEAATMQCSQYPARWFSGIPGAAPTQDSRFLVDNIQEVHNNRQIVDRHCRVHRVLREKGKKSSSITKLKLARLMQLISSATFQKQGRENIELAREEKITLT